MLASTLLAVGGIHPIVALVFGAASGMVLSISTGRGRRAGARDDGEDGAARLSKERAGTVPYLSVAFLWLAFISLLQTLPLPMSVLTVVSPGAATIWGESMRPFGAPAPSWATLSLAPEITRTEAVKWAGYAAMAWVGHRAARRSIGRLAVIALGLALLAAAATAAHGLTGAGKLYGLYETSVSYPRWRMGPLLNANHLSGYLTIGVFAGLGLLFEQRERRPEVRVALLLSIGTLAGGIVLLGSRAAIALLALSLAVTVGFRLALAYRERDRRAARTAWVLLGIVAVGVVLPIVGYQDAIVAGFANKNFAKLVVAEDCVAMVRDFPALGIGRGAFEGVYFAYRSIGSFSVWTHPENFLVQWFTEWGVPGTLVGIGLLVVAVRRGRVRRLRTVASFLGVGVLTVLAQNLVDFSLELPAVMGLAALLGGAILSSASSRSGVPVPAYAPHALAFGILVLAIGAAVARPELESSARKAAWQAQKSSPPATFEPFFRRFPADPYFPLYAAAAAGRTKPLEAMPFHNRMLERAPNWGSAHLAIAETLFRAGYRSQALLEVRIAMERDPSALGSATIAAVTYARNAEDLVSAAPPGPAGLVFLERVVEKLPPGTSRQEIRAAVIERDPCQAQLQEEIGAELAEAIRTGGAPCAGDDRDVCVQRLERGIAAVAICPDGDVVAEFLRVESSWARGNHADSLARMEKLCDARPNAAACFRTLAARAATTKQHDAAARAIRRVTARECDSAERCGAAWAWAARTHASIGDDLSALTAATRATTEVPTELSYHWLRVDLAERSGNLPKVVLSIEAILARSPGDPRATALLQRAKSGR